MGQVQSNVSPKAADQGKPPPPPAAEAPTPSSSDPWSLKKDLMEELEAFCADETEEEAKAQKALDCPCIAELRKGPCGTQFSDAFYCFLKSKAPEKGSDCVKPFVALQSCINENPEAFSKDVLEEEDDNEAEKVPAYSIKTPDWAREPTPQS